MMGTCADDLHRFHRYLRGDRVHHAVVFAGSGAEARMQLALTLARFVLCTERRPGLAACEKCSACRRITQGTHPDVVVVREEGTGTGQGEGKNEIKIETIRMICRQMEVVPLEGRAKVCVLDRAQAMTAASANALLKTLEEPGPGRYFCLLTDGLSSLLPTVVSRCVVFNLMPSVPEEEAAPLLELWEEFLKRRELSVLGPTFQNKEKSAELLRLLQFQLRKATNLTEKEDPDRSLTLLPLFEEAVELEGQLRSNVNAGLLVEDFVRRQWL